MSTQQLLTIYWLESRAELLKSVRIPAFAIPSLLFPVMFYVFFGLVFNQTEGPAVAAYSMATYGTFGVIGPALFSFGVGVAIEKEQGWLALKQSSPMPISAYFIARISTSLVYSCVIVTSLFTLAATFGGVSMTLGQWSLTLFTLLVGSLPFSALGLWLGLILRGQAATAVVNLIYLPMALLSGLWLPIFMFPEALQYVAWIFPAFHLSQLALSVQDMSLGYSIWAHIGALLFTSAILLGLAARAFKRQGDN